MSVFDKITISSLADHYVKTQGCYDGVCELSGVPRIFIQNCIVGGRVMCSGNKKRKILKRETYDEQINDFDAVSLYPSAMARL